MMGVIDIMELSINSNIQRVRQIQVGLPCGLVIEKWIILVIPTKV